MRSCSAKIASAIAALGLFSSSQTVHAVATPIATWVGTSSANWSDAGNWTTGSTPPASLPPGSGDIADFVNAGNGNTNINLGGPQSAGGVQFDTAGAVSYTIGVSSDTLSLANATAVAVTSTVGNAQEIDAALSLGNAGPSITNASATAGLTLGSASTPATISISAGLPTSLTFGVSGGSTIVVNDAINGSVGSSSGLMFSGTGSGNVGSVILNSAVSKYTGITNLNNSTGTVTLGLGASTDSASNSSFTEGPLGTSVLGFNNSNNTPVMAVGADQTIANTITMTFGFTINNAPTPHNLSFTGPISYNATAGRTLTVNTPNQTFTLGSAGAGASTLTLSPTTNIGITIDTTLNTLMVINDVIRDNASAPAIPTNVTYNSVGNNTPQGTVRLSGANTYSGNTSLTGQTSIGTGWAGQVTQVNVDTVMSGSSIVSGPFGKGGLTFNGNANTTSPMSIQAFGADRVVANPVTLSSGFFVTAPSSGAHNLTFTGAIGSDTKTITNNLPSGVALAFGSASSPSTLLLAGATFQSQAAAGGGITIFNDQITGGAATFKGGGVYYFNNTGNSYTGNTSLVGTGAVGTGATIAGKGNVGTGASVLTVSSTTAGSQGGIISPGGDGTTLTGIGTIVVPNLTLDRLGRYVFQYDPTNAAVGSTVNDLVSVVGTLNVTDLANGAFDLNLAPLSAGTPQAQYTLATFASITGATAGSTIPSSAISFSGTAFSPTPTVSVSGDGKSLLLNFAVPEPGSLSLLSFGALSLLRRRRRAM